VANVKSRRARATIWTRFSPMPMRFLRSRVDRPIHAFCTKAVPRGDRLHRSGRSDRRSGVFGAAPRPVFGGSNGSPDPDGRFQSFRLAASERSSFHLTDFSIVQERIVWVVAVWHARNCGAPRRLTHATKQTRSSLSPWKPAADFQSRGAARIGGRAGGRSTKSSKSIGVERSDIVRPRFWTNGPTRQADVARNEAGRMIGYDSPARWREQSEEQGPKDLRSLDRFVWRPRRETKSSTPLGVPLKMSARV